MTVKTGIAEVLDHRDRTVLTGVDTDAGLGALGTERGNLPLESIDVRSTVVGLTVRTELAQGFRNPHDVPLEATYVFPLPDRAAVTGLRMEAADRVVEGILKERGEARADYDRALSEGRRASIAEEERPGVFTMRVGNIMPGESVVIRTTLVGRLPYEDGAATYRFPLVVAPRYIPGAPLAAARVGDGTASDTDAVPDASRISPPVLLPGFPNPVRLSIGVDVDPAGLPIDDVRSSLHGVRVTESDGRIAVTLDPGERADRDFILRLYLGSEDAVTTSLAVQLDADAEDVDSADGKDAADGARGDARTTEAGGTFVLTVLPPTRRAEGLRPRDVVLVLDRSGSMDGWKMVAARRAAARIVDTLTAADRFTVLAFDDSIETAPGLPDGLVEATDRHRFRAVEHLARTDARGGTEMEAPLRQAADLLAAAPGEPRDRVLVLLTDGQVGDEDRILASLEPRLSGVRVHTLGIDRAVNEAFLQRLARVSGGRYELVESEDRLDEAMVRIHRRIGSPEVTGLRLTAAGLAIDGGSVEPARLPDLFTGAPVVISGRFTGKPDGALTVAGEAADGSAWQTTVPAAPVAESGMAAVWARGRVRDLEDRYVIGDDDLPGLERDIVATSLRFSVLCRFTAFVAVDARVVNEGGGLRKVTQPVDAPDGWAMFEPQADVAVAGHAYAPARMRKAFGAAPPMVSMPSAPAPAPAPAAAPEAAMDWVEEERSQLAEATAYPDQAESGYAAPKTDMQRKESSVAPPADLRSAAAELLSRLRAAETQPAATRILLLASLPELLRDLVLRFGIGGRDAATTRSLGELAVELAGPEPDDAELDRRWDKAVSVLETVVKAPEPRASRAFWKR